MAEQDKRKPWTILGNTGSSGPIKVGGSAGSIVKVTNVDFPKKEEVEKIRACTKPCYEEYKKTVAAIDAKEKALQTERRAAMQKLSTCRNACD